MQEEMKDQLSSDLWPIDHVNPWGFCANDNGYGFLFASELILWLKKKKIYQKLKGLSMWGEGIKKKKAINQMTGRKESLRIYSDLH